MEATEAKQAADWGQTKSIKALKVTDKNAEH